MDIEKSSVHTVGLYSAIENEILLFSGKWIELEATSISEKRTQKNKYCVFFLISRV